MPSGVYKRTKLVTAKQLEALSKGREIGRKVPRSSIQIESIREVNRRPRTAKQRESSRKKARCMGLACHADRIVKHHNDLYRGKLRPDDITIMTHKEHRRLHAKMEYLNRKRDEKGRFI